MPITRGAKKALRVAGRRKIVNDRRKKAMKDATKNVEKEVRTKKVNKETLSHAYSTIDKALKKGVIKKNTAARRKSRLARIAKGVQ
jgi:small subunit ribosomal protein S20